MPEQSQPENQSPRARSVTTTTHGRYLIDTPEEPGARPLLVGFHGYAETAEIHLDCLRRIPGSGDWLRAAVQALHPFYARK